MSSAVSGLLRAANTLTTSLSNVSAHYDISNDMFAAFLSPDMTYSCPIWAPVTSGHDGDRDAILTNGNGNGHGNGLTNGNGHGHGLT